MAKKLILLLSLLFGAFAFADAKDGDIQYLVVAEKNGCVFRPIPVHQFR